MFWDHLNPVYAVKDAVLFPFRMAQAIFQYFNFFSVRYTGKPLATSKGAAQRHPDLKQMMIWGNLIDADRAASENRFGDPDAPSLVPSSWQLVRRSPGGTADVARQGRPLARCSTRTAAPFIGWRRVEGTWSGCWLGK
jgi:hypothetical protein